MGTLGHKVFVPLILSVPDNTDITAVGEEPKLYLTRTVKQINFTVKAFGKQTADGFVVLKGSLISPKDAAYLSKGDLERRKHRKVDDNNVLLEDVLFNTPSGAATFVIGKNANGWIEWKTADGRTLHDLENSEEIPQ